MSEYSLPAAVGTLAFASQVIGVWAGPVGVALAIVNLILKYALPVSSMPPVQRNTIVRVAVGLDNAVFPDNPLKGAGGSSPMVVAFDENRDFVGLSQWSKQTTIASGGYVDIEVFSEKDRQFVQAPYLQILAQDDPICIASVVETWTDNQRRAWTGNQGPACGYQWGYSNIVLGHVQDTGKQFKPYCTWISRNHQRGIYPSGLQIYMDDFWQTEKNPEASNDTRKYCNPPTMLFIDEHFYEFPHDFRVAIFPLYKKHAELYQSQRQIYVVPPELAYLTKRPSATASASRTSATSSALARRENPVEILEHQSFSSAAEKRSLQKREEALADLNPHHIITSADHQHSASLACTKPGYLGPDVVSLHEQLFCDIKTNTLWKVCPSHDNASTPADTSADEDDEGCFHKEELSLVKAGRLHKRSYRRSEVWELNGDIVVDGVVVNKQE